MGSFPAAGDKSVYLAGPLTSESEEIRFFMAYGVQIEVRAPEAVWAEMPRVIVPGSVKGCGRPTDLLLSVEGQVSPFGSLVYAIVENGRHFATEPSAEATARTVEACIAHFIAEHSEQLIFVHAGVVVWKEKAILLPGRSWSGKSTLVVALVKAGARYYSDEYALLDDEGWVYGFQRRPNLRNEQYISGSGLHLSTAHSPPPVRVGSVVMSHFCAGCIWQTRRLTAGDTLLVLLNNTVAVRKQPERTIRVLGRALRDAEGFACKRSEAAEAACRILAGNEGNRN